MKVTDEAANINRSFAGKFSVNLLPKEILLQRTQSSKLALISKLSIGMLVILVFLASATLALRIAQGVQLKGAKHSVVLAEDKISSLKGKEEALIALKQRLISIKKLSSQDAKIKAIFNLVVYLTPPGVQINEASVDQNGNMGLVLASTDLSSFNTMVGNLGNKEKNGDMIAKVDLSSLSLTKDAVYRFALKITPR